MTRWRVLLGVASALVLAAGTASAQGVGIFSRASCSTINAAEPGKTFCFDQTANTLKYWDGVSWKSQGFATPSVINLKDYATGNGSTDDSTGIANALAALNTTGISGITGGLLIVPPGTYSHSNTITWPNKAITVLCSSDATSYFNYTGTGTGNSVNSDGSTYPLTFENCGFTNSSTATFILDFWRPGRLTMLNPRIRALAGNPIGFRIRGDTSAAQQTTLINPYIAGGGLMSEGLVLEGTTFPGVTITNIYAGRVDQTTTNGMRFSTVEGVNVYGTNIEGHAVGVLIEGSRVINIDGPWFESNTGADVRVTATVTSANGVTVSRSRFASSSVPYNFDLQTPGGGLDSRAHRFTLNSVTASPTGANVRIQGGVTATIHAFNWFSNAPEFDDSGTCTSRIGNILADGTTDFIVPCGAVRLGSSTVANTGTGTTNNASATYINGRAVLIASTASVNVTNVQGLSATESKSNNLRGACNFAAANTCVVQFNNNEPDAHYFVITNGLVNISGKGKGGFTMTATTNNSNVVDWLLVR